VDKVSSELVGCTKARLIECGVRYKVFLSATGVRAELLFGIKRVITRGRVILILLTLSSTEDNSEITMNAKTLTRQDNMIVQLILPPFRFLLNP
jgi:hypothetical protein